MYVGLFDILGFRTFLERTPLAEVVDRMAAIDAIASGAAKLPTLTKSPPGSTFDYLIGEAETCGVIRFSDTILLYAPEDEGPWDIIMNCWMLMNAAMKAGVPLRGALTKGDLHVSPDKRTYVGKALVHAYELEQAQEWAGAVLDPERLGPREMEPRDRAELYENGFLFRYLAPMKRGEAREYECIGWPGNAGWPEDHLRARLSSFGEPNDWSGRAKIDRALDFLRAYSAAQEKERAERAQAKRQPGASRKG